LITTPVTILSFAALVITGLVWIVLASINYKLGRIASALEKLADIEMPVSTSAISELGYVLDNCFYADWQALKDEYSEQAH